MINDKSLMTAHFLDLLLAFSIVNQLEITNSLQMSYKPLIRTNVGLLGHEIWNLAFLFSNNL